MYFIQSVLCPFYVMVVYVLALLKGLDVYAKGTKKIARVDDIRKNSGRRAATLEGATDIMMACLGALGIGAIAIIASMPCAALTHFFPTFKWVWVPWDEGLIVWVLALAVNATRYAFAQNRRRKA